jgi:microcystin-dependent protein
MKKNYLILLISFFTVAALVYGQDAITIISNGNVGIGITNPHNKLEVNGRISDKTGLVTPVGSILWWTTPHPPEGWLLCDGRPVSRTTYSDLFEVIGTIFGAGDGSTTFNLPPLAYNAEHNVNVRIIRSLDHNQNIGHKDGDDDAIVVQHTHKIRTSNAETANVVGLMHGRGTRGVGGVDWHNPWISYRYTDVSGNKILEYEGISGNKKNIPAYVALLPIIKY